MVGLAHKRYFAERLVTILQISRIAWSLAFLVLLAPILQAGTASGYEITYQGFLEHAGEPASGSFDFEFTLWSAGLSGTQVGPTIFLQDVPAHDGIFQVELDFGAAAFDGDPRWLRIRVALADGTLTTLAPRQAVKPAPYAHFAYAGNEGPQGPPGDNALWESNGSDRMWFLGNHVSIGANSTAGALHVQTSEDGSAIVATTTVGEGVGVRAHAPGIGVFGESTKPTGLGYGVFGEAESTDGRAVYGQAAASNGSTYGVYGSAASSTGTGVFGESPWQGVAGIANGTAGDSIGVYGESPGTSGRGVHGRATAASGETSGVFGQTSSPSGAGVRGLGPSQGVVGSASLSSGVTYGVTGMTPSAFGRGVFGHATSTSGVPIGVYAKADTNTGYDFYADGAGLDYGGASSRRWKSNIASIGEPLEKVSQLRGVYFDWDLWHGGHHDVGMIAEEVGEVLPEIVRYEENGVDAMGMDYSKLTPLLVEAVNALRAEKDAQIAQQAFRIDQLETRNSELQARIDALATRVAAVELNDSQTQTAGRW